MVLTLALLSPVAIVISSPDFPALRRAITRLRRSCWVTASNLAAIFFMSPTISHGWRIKPFNFPVIESVKKLYIRREPLTEAI
jgi:hypothetical protein